MCYLKLNILLGPLQAEVESSFEAIKDIRLAAKAAVLKNGEEKALLDSKVWRNFITFRVK